MRRAFYHRVCATALLLLTFTVSFPAQQLAAPADLRQQAWTVLNEGLQHQHASHRIAAVEALGVMPGDRRAVEHSITALNDKNLHVRTAAATSLGQLRERRAVPALREALTDPEVSVVLAAAHSLYLLKDKSAYEVYYAILMGDRKSSDSLIQSQLDRLKDPKQMMELGIQEGIGFIPFGGMGYGAYRELQRHSGAPARAAAAQFLAMDPDQISEDALLQTALADSNELVRLAALDALAQRGDSRCVERLAKNLAADEKSSVRYRTAAVILHLSGLRKGKN